MSALHAMPLQIMEVGGDFVKYAENLPLQYNDTLPARHGAKPSHNDYLALALAKQESCTLPGRLHEGSVAQCAMSPSSFSR